MILLVHFSVVHRLGADKKVGAEETTTTSRDSRDEVRGRTASQQQQLVIQRVSAEMQLDDG